MRQPVATALRSLGCGLCVAAASAATALPPGPPHGGPAMVGAMVTRSVARYQDLERALLDALARGDGAAAARLLDEGFTARAAASPDPQARVDWLQQALGPQSATWRHRPWQVRDLAVREVDDIAVVSFLLDPGAPGSRAGALFVVDVWRQSTGLLLNRATSRAADAPPTPTRPSGRG